MLKRKVCSLGKDARIMQVFNYFLFYTILCKSSNALSRSLFTQIEPGGCFCPLTMFGVWTVTARVIWAMLHFWIHLRPALNHICNMLNLTNS